jgi:pyrroline-5-carboxylate reductase
MGEALLGGILEAGWCKAVDVAVVEASDARRSELAARFPGVAVGDRIGEADGTIVATKPAQVLGVVREVAKNGCPRILSVAAGVPLVALEVAAGREVAVVRAMPNTPALVGRGAAAIAGGSEVTDDDLRWAEELLSAVGVVVRVDEPLLDAVTGLSGSGPAYVFLVAEALVEAGVLVGLTRPVAEQLAHQTLLGAAHMLVETGEPAAELRAGVTSPGGTTAAALRVLESSGVRAALIDAVVAARDRSVEMGTTQRGGA